MVEYRVQGYETSPDQTNIKALLIQILEGMSSGTIVQPGGDPYSLKTIASYKSVIHSRLIPEFGSKRVAQLSHRDAQAFIDRLVAEGLAGQTIQNIRSPLAVLMRRSIKQNVIRSSPLDHLDVPSSKGGRDRAATRYEVNELIDVLRADPNAGLFDAAVWSLFFLTGVRHSEAQGLRWGDIDFENEEIRIRYSWNQSATVKARKGLKSKAARREVPLPEITEEALIELRLERGIPGADEYVLLDLATGYPMRQEKIRKRARSVWDAHGLDSYSPHEARHTFGSISAAAGVAPWDLAVMMGHSDPQLTFQRYRHIYREERKRAKNKIDDYMRDASDRSGT